jgi:hypothetical protein
MEKFLEELIKEYNELYEIEVGGTTYYYRALSLQEIKESDKLEDETEREDFIVNLCVVYPDIDFDKIKAGYINVLAEAIMSSSGILDLDTVLEYLHSAREFYSHDAVSILKAYVISAMPSYSDESLENYTIKSLINKVAMSEQILTLKQSIMGIHSDGVKVEIVPLDQVEKAKPENKMTKEQLLSRISKTDRETANARMLDPTLKQKLSEIDEDLLRKALGETSSNDPIAAKLHGGR